jgi:signal transduction histidine kinase
MNERSRQLIERLRSVAPELVGDAEALAAEVEAKAAAVEDANRLRSAFLQNLSHEVRTPITVMRGLLDVLAQDVGGGLSDEQRDLIDRACHSSQQVLDLIEGVLSLSKAEVGMIEARRSRVYFPDLFTDLVRGVEAQLQKKRVRLVVDLPRGIEWITVDGRLLQSLVSHLLSNAAKFTARGEVRLRARLIGEAPPATADALRAAEPSGDTLEIRVEDTGEGIPPDLQSRLFEPFRQADGSMRRRHEGLGIGLSLARRLADALGATLEVTSRVGEGTEVLVRVPLVAAEGETVASAPSLSPVSSAMPLRSRGMLTDLANLALVFPSSEAEAVSFALDLVDRLLGCEVCFYASLPLDGAPTIADLVGHGEHGLGLGSAVPLAAETLARLGRERRTVHDRSWIANGVFLRADDCIGVLAARLPSSIATSDDAPKILQVAAGWLGREVGLARRARQHAELVATIGRDLKRPLGAALGHSQALLRGLHGTLTQAQRWTALEIDRAVHRVILSALEILDYERVTARGFEVNRQRFALRSIVDHVLSRQSADVELAHVSVRSDVDEDLPACSGDLVRADRALAIVVHEVLGRITEPREIAIRAVAQADAVCVDVEAHVREAAPFVASLAGAATPPEPGETLALRLARGWVEAQGGRLDAISEPPLLRVRFRFARASD